MNNAIQFDGSTLSKERIFDKCGRNFWFTMQIGDWMVETNEGFKSLDNAVYKLFQAQLNREREKSKVLEEAKNILHALVDHPIKDLINLNRTFYDLDENGKPIEEKEIDTVKRYIAEELVKIDQQLAEIGSGDKEEM